MRSTKYWSMNNFKPGGGAGVIHYHFLRVLTLFKGDSVLEAKVLANKDESKCLKPLIAVIRPVRDRFQRGRFLWKLKMVPIRRLTFDTVCQLSRWLDVVEASSSGSNKAMCWFAGGARPHWHHRCCELWICPCMYLPGIQSLNFRPCVGILLDQSIEFWR